jgi:hypothetical protein
VVIKNIIDRLRSADESVITGMDIYSPVAAIASKRRLTTRREKKRVQRRVLGRKREG